MATGNMYVEFLPLQDRQSDNRCRHGIKFGIVMQLPHYIRLPA